MKLPFGVFNRWMDKEADMSSDQDSDSSSSPNVAKKRFRNILTFLLKERIHSEGVLLIKDKDKEKEKPLTYSLGVNRKPSLNVAISVRVSIRTPSTLYI